MRVDKEARISWTGSGMVFDGGPVGGPQMVVDGDAATGPSPMDLLLLGLAACMAIDVRMILEKSRVPLDGLDVHAEGTRAETPPRRYTAVRLTYRVSGVDPSHRDKLDRAIELSRERYCSVLHSFREELPLEILVEGI